MILNLLYRWFSVILVLVFFCSQAPEKKSTDNYECDFIKKGEGSKWVYLEENRVTPFDLCKSYKKCLGLTDDDSLGVIDIKRTNTIEERYTIQQFRNGTVVNGASAYFHTRNGYVFRIKQNFIPNIKIQNQKLLQKEDIFEVLNKFFSQDSLLISTSQVSSELILYVDKSKSGVESAVYYCWKVLVVSKVPLKSRIILLDAESGEIIKVRILGNYCFPGTGTTAHHGTQNIHSQYINSILGYRLYDACNHTNFTATLHTIEEGLNPEYYDSDNSWTNSSDIPGVQTHWAAHMVLEYFGSYWGRNSYDGNGGNLICNNDFNFPIGNNSNHFALWDEINTIHLGVGSPFDNYDNYNTLDIIGHEFTHGVTQHEGDLSYQNESGALNESFSDIFGTAVERWVTGNENWEMGEQRGTPMRNLSNPNLYGQPDTRLGDNWFHLDGCIPNGNANDPEYNDNCGVHTNSGVQNYWFYLLVNGGNDTNDLNNIFNVVGIGFEDAIAITYRNLTLELSGDDNYDDAREGSINAATFLFGANSQQVCSVKQAWYAVGVGPNCVSNLPDLIILDTQVPASPIASGSSVSVSFKNKNQGSASAGSSYTSIWLSQDQVFQGTPVDINLNTGLLVPALGVGATSGNILDQLTIPTGIIAGTWYIVFKADALSQVYEGNGENNNLDFVPITITSGGCILPIINSHPANRFVNAPTGTTFTISASGSNNLYQWQVNTGSGWTNVPAGSPYSGINSTTLTLSSSNTGMSGNQYRCHVTSTCTAATATSNAAILTVSSSSGCNNDYSCGPPSPLALTINSACVFTGCTTVGASPPTQNIGFSCWGNPYQSGRYDDDVWFTITPTNTNTVTILVVPTSNMSNFDPVIGLYSGACLTPTQLACADQNSNGGNEQLVFTPVAGTTYLIRVFSYGMSTSNSGNFNICVTSPGQPASNPDLIISNAELSDYSMCSGSTFAVSYDVVNVGGTTAPSSTVKYYLSSNSTYSGGDVLLGSSSISSLGSNASVSKSKTLTIPSGTNSGTWYILIIADANEDVNEGTNGENNNVSAEQLQLTNCTGIADLVIDYISHTPTTITPGLHINVNFEAENIGTEYAPTNRIGVYISTDNSFDPTEDQFLDDWTQTPLDPGETDNDDLNFKIPNCYPCGSYYIFLYIDYLNTVNEVTNNNNFDSFPIQIVGCVTCSYSVPATGINFQSAGGTGNFTVTTTNCCPWTATTSDNWITIITGTGQGTGNVYYSVEPCSSGGTRNGTITVAGQTHTITQNCIVACNTSQSFEWAVKAGSATLSDAAADVAIDASGNLFMTGDIQGAADFGSGIILTTPSNAPDIFVSKHNSSGQIQWALRFGSTTGEAGTGIATDSNGDIYVIGSVETSTTFGSTTITNNGTNNGAAFLLKLNPAGVVQWVQKINGSHHAVPSDITIDNNNNIYVTGYHSNYTTGHDAVFVAKYNVSGTQSWFQLYGPSINIKQGFGIACDNSGNVIVCGRYMQTVTFGTFTLTASTILDMDGFIMKLSNAGSVIWARKLTSPGQGQDALSSIAVDNSDNIYTIGHVDSSAVIESITLPLTDGDKLIIIKYDQNGIPIWAKASTTGFQSNMNRITKGNDNDLYFTGSFITSLKIDTFTVLSIGESDGYLGRIDENGKVKWIKGFGGTLSESGNGLVLDNANNIFVAGDFRGTVTFGSTILTSAGSSDIYLARFKQCDPPVTSINYSGPLSLCSNPYVTLSTDYCPSNSYQWQLNNFDIPGANGPVYNATQPGSYTIKVLAYAGCETVSSPVQISSTMTYTFIGSGNWDVAANWSNSLVPPAVLPPCGEIIINPVGNDECVLNVTMTLSPGAKITVAPGKKFRVSSIQ